MQEPHGAAERGSLRLQPLKERIVREVGYGLAREVVSAAGLVKSMQARSQPVARKGKSA